MMLNLACRRCVVIGAGKIAAAKIEGLLLAGADVTVISPRATQQIQRWAKARTLTWRRRAFVPADLDSAFLAIAAANSNRANAAVFRACRARGVLCNAVDDPQHCDFFYPAVVRRGPLQITVSTSGKSPALAARLRRELEQHFGPEWADWVEQLGQTRQALLRRNLSVAERKKLLLRLVTPEAFLTFVRNRCAPQR